jgi:hypothetical protein
VSEVEEGQEEEKRREYWRVPHKDVVLLFVFEVSVPCDVLSTRKMHLQIGFFEFLQVEKQRNC